MTARKPIFFTRRFLPMWLGQSFGALSDNMNRQVLIVGVPFGVVSLAGFDTIDAALPIIGALFPVAMLIGSMYGGQFAEKFETQMMFRRTKILEIVLMLFAAYGLITDQGWFLVLALFGMGLQSSSFNPVRQSAMPKYLETEELIRGNGLINAGLYGCILIGTGLGGYFIALKPDAALFESTRFIESFGLASTPKSITGIVMVIFSILGYAFVWFAPKAAPTNPDLKIDWLAIPAAIKMVRFTFAEASVVRPLIGITLFYFVSTMVTIALPLYARDTLGTDALVVTFFMLAFAVGAGVGALVSAAISKGNSALRSATIGVTLAAICSAGIFILSLTFSPNLDGSLIESGEFVKTWRGILLLLLFFLCSVFLGIYLAPLQAAIQRRAPNDRRARILAVVNMSVAIAALLGSLSTLAITQTALRPEHSFIALSLMLGGVALYMMRRAKQVPDGLYDEMLQKK